MFMFLFTKILFVDFLPSLLKVKLQASMMYYPLTQFKNDMILRKRFKMLIMNIAIYVQCIKKFGKPNGRMENPYETST